MLAIRAPAFASAVPLGLFADRSQSAAPRRASPCCVTPIRPRGGSKRPRVRPKDGGKNGFSGPRRPRLDLGESERLQKVMSRLGVASRRRSEQLIAEGQVRVNGRVVRDQGVHVNSRKDRISVQGKYIEAEDRAVWVAVHKPRGYLSLPRDSGKKTVLDIIPRKKRTGLVTVGNIGEDDSGIVILTSERGHVPELSSPQNAHVKEWVVDCEGVVKDETVEPLQLGVLLKGEVTKTRPAGITIVGSERVEVAEGEKKILTRMEVRVRESRRHLVRRLFAHVGLTVVRASRKSFGPILLGSLKRGDFRYLTPNEVKALTRGVKRSNVESSSS